MRFDDLFCNYEECIMKIKSSINTYSKNELYNLLPKSEYLSIASKVKHLVTGPKLDIQGKIRFSDELDPDKLTDYLLLQKEYSSSRDLIYACVCRFMVAPINEFYADLNKEGFSIRHYSGSSSLYNLDMDIYANVFEARKALPHKRLRGKS